VGDYALAWSVVGWGDIQVNAPLFFENAGDDRGTPQKLFDELNAEFHFDIDAAADEHNHKCDLYYGQGGIEFDALEADWAGMTVFLNPPYSVAGGFIAKAREEADKGSTVVMLLPVRSDTRYWHSHIWDKTVNNWRPGVQCRFLSGRLTFELRVPDHLRAWIKSQYAADVTALEEGSTKERSTVLWYSAMVEATGLPRMSLSRILEDYPDDELLEGAPFPSCVVIFTKAV
jgi:phage N-6-adenine-methyltransferase